MKADTMENENEPTTMSEEIQKPLAEQIADTLGEKQFLARKQIQSIVDRFGEEGAIALLQETLDIEANGGLLTSSGTRRRTIGGIFFHLALQNTQPMERYQLRQNFVRKTMLEKGEIKPRVIRPFKWQPQKLEELFERHGEITAVKIVLTGRPGRLQHYKEMIVTTMRGTGMPNQLPRGVPIPPSTPTDYIVYISSKQWKKVSEAIKNPEDVLVIEGYCAYDTEAKAIGVYTTAITTKLLRIALKEKQKAESTTRENGEGREDGDEAVLAVEAAPKPAPTKSAAPKAKAPAPKPQPAAPPPPAPAAPEPSLSRDEAAAMLKELYKAEDEAREAMDEIKSLPPSEQTGLGEALRELTRIKNDIKAIKQMYPGM
jgi:cell division septation protein DedD